MKAINHFLQDERGQDLIEYSLIVTFVVLACLVLIATGRPATNAIWTSANSQLTNAANFAS